MCCITIPSNRSFNTSEQFQIKDIEKIIDKKYSQYKSLIKEKLDEDDMEGLAVINNKIIYEFNDFFVNDILENKVENDKIIALLLNPTKYKFQSIINCILEETR